MHSANQKWGDPKSRQKVWRLPVFLTFSNKNSVLPAPQLHRKVSWRIVPRGLIATKIATQLSLCGQTYLGTQCSHKRAGNKDRRMAQAIMPHLSNQDACLQTSALCRFSSFTRISLSNSFQMREKQPRHHDSRPFTSPFYLMHHWLTVLPSPDLQRHIRAKCPSNSILYTFAALFREERTRRIRVLPPQSSFKAEGKLHS